MYPDGRLTLFDEPDQGPRTTYERRSDDELDSVAEVLLHEDPTGERIAWVVRETFDQAYDGQRTGRWDYSQLHKTEKTHIGTLIEINLQREFNLGDGRRLDYTIAGVDVDCKFSRKPKDWELPREMYKEGPQLALLVWASDSESRWSAGIVRVEDGALRKAANQDGKRKLSDEGLGQVRWLFQNYPLPENTLLHLPDADREAVLAAGSGQARVDELFRRVQGRIIDRATICTVARQDDALKRARDSRARLKSEGVVVFGHYEPHPSLARLLGLPSPSKGQFVSARVCAWADGDPELRVEIDGRVWRLARLGDPVVDAPDLPKQGRP